MMEWSSRTRPPSRLEKWLAAIIFVGGMLLAASADSLTAMIK